MIDNECVHFIKSYGPDATAAVHKLAYYGKIKGCSTYTNNKMVSLYFTSVYCIYCNGVVQTQI